MKRNGDVDRALELLRSGKVATIAEACRKTGAAKSTVSDNWRRDQGHPEFPDAPNADVEDVRPSEIPVVVRDFSDEEHHFVYPLGDIHKGSPQHQRDKWREWLLYVQHAPLTSMIGTGDFLNCAIKDSVSDTYAEESTVSQAKWELADELTPVKDKIDCLIRGNHEDRIWRVAGEDPIYDVARHLGVAYSPATIVVVYLVGDQTYTFDVRHGKGGGQIGARANRLKRLAMTVRADVYVSGHTHSQLVFPDEYFDIDVDAQAVVRRKQMFVSSGSFLSYEDYASTAGFNPTHIGAPRIRLNGHTHDVHVSV